MILQNHINTNIHTVAFYNLENLFDTKDNPLKQDNDFTPRGKKRWTEKRYRRKIKKLGRAISHVGYDKSYSTPTLVGISEVENKECLHDLINSKHLRNRNYAFVHYDSKDERGIDVALIYKSDVFQLRHAEKIEVNLPKNHEGNSVSSRDILYVKGKFINEEVHVFVNHWSSRRDGEEETRYKRLKASEVLTNKLYEIFKENNLANVIVMGDFNDDPKSESVKNLLKSQFLYNPMEKLYSYTKGSLNHQFHWYLFDQILFTHNFFDYQKGTLSFLNANIFDDHFLREFQGRNKGNPFRTYRGRKYLGGYSDHFPVYMHLKFNK